MATHRPAEPLPSHEDNEDRYNDDRYDEVVENSFPASDPPAGVIKVGPRRSRLSAVPPPSARRSPPSKPN